MEDEKKFIRILKNTPLFVRVKGYYIILILEFINKEVLDYYYDG